MSSFTPMKSFGGGKTTIRAMAWMTLPRQARRGLIRQGGRSFLIGTGEREVVAISELQGIEPRFHYPGDGDAYPSGSRTRAENLYH